MQSGQASNKTSPGQAAGSQVSMETVQLIVLAGQMLPCQPRRAIMLASGHILSTLPVNPICAAMLMSAPYWA